MAKKTSLWALLLVMLVTMLTAGCGGGSGEKKAAPATYHLYLYEGISD